MRNRCKVCGMAPSHCSCAKPLIDCVCYRGHCDDCPNFDFKQGYANLKSDIESLQQLTSDGFEIRIFATSVEFVLEAKHPSQTEEFLSDSAVGLIRDVSKWVAHCDQGK